MALEEYKKKRNFKVTSEPGPTRVKKKSGHLAYVIQKHHASHLHYDFRLEWNGVLKSWAVPKGPSLDPSVKRLAVEVEDHPVAYGTFEGKIPPGEYGAGDVIVWDRGWWNPLGDPGKGLKSGRLEFTLEGEKLKGRWILVRTGRGSGKPQWLLMKRTDEAAENHPATEITEERPESVKTGKFLPGEEGPTRSQPSIRKKAKGKISYLKARTAKRGKRKEARLKFNEPQLAQLASEPPAGPGWVHEIKFDGYRTLTRIQNGKSTYYTRSGLNWSEKYRGLDSALAKLPAATAWLDGEICVADGEGRTSFNALQRALTQSRTKDLVYYVFDLLEIDGEDLRELPLSERKSRLKALFSGLQAVNIVYSDHWAGNGRALLKASCGRDLEGVISKKIDAPYTSGRGPSWVKAKCHNGHGDRQLRQASFKGLREDKSAAEVVPEMPIKGKKSAKSPAKASSKTKAEPAARKGARRLTHPDKILIPGANVTKGDVARYYETFEAKILPHVKSRPLSLLRCPEGIRAECFFQKHLYAHHPDQIETTETKTPAGKSDPLIFIENGEGLIALAQMGVLEIHTRGTHVEHPGNPDLIVFDLDPGPGVPWKNVVKGTLLVRDILRELGLDSFVKTSGGKGFHIHVPIAPLYTWEQVKNFSKSVAVQLSRENPKLFISELAKSKRVGKIFIDYLRNGYGATSVAPYGIRARAGGPIAMPIDWEDVPKVKANAFKLKDILKDPSRIKGDPWRLYFKKAQKIAILEDSDPAPRLQR